MIALLLTISALASLLVAACIMQIVMLRRLKRAIDGLRLQQDDQATFGLTRRMIELQKNRFMQSHRVRDPRAADSD